jgi:multiple sugar transport system permease protein
VTTSASGRSNRIPRGVLVGTALPTVIAATVGLLLVQRAATKTWEHLLLDETTIGAQLVRESAGTALLDRTPLAARWQVLDTTGFDVDATALVDEGATSHGVAPITDADGWFTIAMLRIDPSRPAPVLPPFIWLLWLASCGALLLIAHAWKQRVALLSHSLVAASVSSVVLIALFAVAGRWCGKVLGEATDRRVEVAVRALRAADANTLIDRPGAIAQLTGTGFVLYDAGHRTRFSTLPPAPTSDLESVMTPARRVMADRVRYAVADAGPIRLAVVPYEHTRHPGTSLAIVATVALLASVLSMSLQSQVAQPRALRRTLTAWGFLAPSAVHLGVFTFGPLAFAAWLSTHRWSLVEETRPFVWFDNYRGALTDGTFWHAIANTTLFTLHVPVAMLVALALALLVHRPARGVGILRALLFLPTITSLVAIAVVWQWMFNQEYGLINWVLSVVGLPRVPWLTSPQTALISLMIMAVWLVVGYQVVLFQAGLTTIPRDLYDAARMDGAGPLRRFYHVTLPGLRPTIFFVLITSVIGSFQVFGAVYIMTEGGPLRATDVAVYHIYEEAWEFLRFGNAAAMSWVLFAIIFVITWLHFRMLERRMA